MGNVIQAWIKDRAGCGTKQQVVIYAQTHTKLNQRLTFISRKTFSYNKNKRQKWFKNSTLVDQNFNECIIRVVSKSNGQLVNEMSIKLVVHGNNT